MISLLLPALLLLVQDPVAGPEAPAVAQDAPPAAAPATPAPAAKVPDPGPGAKEKGKEKQPELKPLSFFSQRFPFRWNQFLPLTAEVDGLRINSIFFNKRTANLGVFGNPEFGTRAVVDVTNTTSDTRHPGFAVAVYDDQDRLLGVASGGPLLGGVRAGATMSFTLSFSQVVERIPKADHYYLSVELTN